MDRGHTYGLPGTAERATLYLPLMRRGLRDVFEPPAEIQLRRAETGEDATFVLLDDTVLNKYVGTAGGVRAVIRAADYTTAAAIYTSRYGHAPTDLEEVATND